MIKLTWTDERRVEEFYVNPRYISIIVGNNLGSEVFMASSDEKAFPVLETPKQILSKIEEWKQENDK